MLKIVQKLNYYESLKSVILAGKVTWIKHWLYKCRYLNLESQNPCKGQASVAVICHPSTHESETGIPTVRWLGCPAHCNPASIDTVESNWRRHKMISNSGFHMLTCANGCTRIHTNVYSHTCKMKTCVQYSLNTCQKCFLLHDSLMLMLF